MERNVEIGIRALMARVVAVCGLVAMAVSLGAQELVRQQEAKPTVVMSEPRVTERGSHHRVIERTITETLPNGKTVERRSAYTEIATGMHYQNERGEWLESREEIEIIDGSAVARQGPVQAVWSATLNREGAVDVLTPDGKRFRSHILGLAYTDAVSGRSVLIAEPKECVGEVVGNQVYYRDAFDGPFRADVRYTYTMAGVSQDILIRETLPSPQEYGLGERCRIEVWTEFTMASEPAKGFGVLKTEGDAQVRALMADPDLTDETLDFGAMRIGHGAAFPLETDATDGFEKESAPVGKNWLQLEGRTFLIEKVDLRDIEEEVSRLPKSAALNAAAKARMQAAAGKALPRRELLASLGGAPRREAGKDQRMIRTASLPTPEKGFVLDYSMVSTATNFTFKAGGTFFISATVNLAGHTILEPVVLKFTNGSSALKILGTLDCRTDAYRPAIFTAKDDNTVGETIVGSTGHPTNANFYGRQVDVTGNTNVIDLHDVHLRHGNYGVYLNSASRMVVRHAQFSSNHTAVVMAGADAWLRNVLIHNTTYAFGGGSTNPVKGEQMTFHRVLYLRSATGATYSNTHLTNSLVINVSNLVTYTGVNVISNLSDTGYFQTVGGGARYLVNSSTNRNAGTTNINPALLADLKQRTTEPPATLFSSITANTNLAPLIAGDTTVGDLPDLGYHYPVIDYFASGAAINTNVTVVATNGVNIAIDYSQSDWGFPLTAGKFISQGSANATNRIIRAYMVQERDTQSANGSWAMFHDQDGGAGQASEARFRFTEIIQQPTDGYVFYSGRGLAAFEATHSSLYGVSLVLDITGTGTLAIGLTNNLVDSGGAQFGVGGTGAGTTVHLRNNLFRNASLHFLGGTTNWTVRDNVFYGAGTNVNDHSSPVQNSYNAWCDSTNQYLSGGTSDVLTTNLAYELGPRGRYYLPAGSSLANAGSRTADLAGLYHFTTATNQVRETNSTVDIGLHYVALDGFGQPVDTDADGMADYLEDANGNGVSDGGETSAVNPVLTVAGSLTYIKGGPGKRFDTNAVAHDADSTNLAGAKLTLTITTGGESGDRLAVRNQGTNAGQISVSGTNVSYGGVLIATNSGGSGTTPLVIYFNASAGNAALQALARNLTFQNLSNNPANSNRVVAFELVDGKGGTNAPTTVAINIVCPDAVDVMMLFDVSGSMVKVFTNGVFAGYDTNRFWTAKAAASNFVSMLDFTADRVGLITFDEGAYFVHALTTNGAAVQASIYSQTVGIGTILDPSINMARTNYATSGTNTLRLIVILSDGEEWPASNTTATIAAAEAAKDEGVRIISIGFHTGECTGCGGTNHMRLIASADSDYYFAPSFEQMQSNFTAVAQSLCRGNEFPTVSITSPTNGASLAAPLNTTITIAASDDGSVTNVALRINGTSVTNFTTAPYSYEWTNVLGGSYALTAVATDNTGQTSTSAVVNVTVVKQLPQVSIVAPTNATHFAAVMHLLVRAAATDADGTITNVVFYTNNVAAVTNATPPFRFPWTNLPSGSYAVYAKAWDNDGQTTNSTSVTFDVDACPQVGVSNLTLSASTVPGGSNLTAIVTLATNAPAGGQMVELICADSNVSIPASVWVPAGTNQAAFRVDTFASVTNAVATIAAATPGTNKTASLTVQTNAILSARFVGQCGPMDVVFVVDKSASSLGAFIPLSLANLRFETVRFQQAPLLSLSVSNMLENIQMASGGDYRLALVSYASNRVDVGMQFSQSNKGSFFQTFTNLQTVCEQEAIFRTNDPSTEALNTVINALPATARPLQQGDFTNAFRLEARKIIVLMTENGPMSFGEVETGNVQYDTLGAHQRAVEAALKGIQICPIVHLGYDGSGDSYYVQAAFDAAKEYEFTTGGQFFVANGQAGLTNHSNVIPPVDPVGLDVCLMNIVSACGAELGEIVVTRDDLHNGMHSGVSLNNGSLSATTLNAAKFDLSSVEGRVSDAHLQRAGRLRVNYGSQFDLGLGAGSVLEANLAFFAAPMNSAQTNGIDEPYLAAWALPFSFFADMQGYLGGTYPVALLDRVSSTCGNNFEVIDTPQFDWPAARNTLTLKTLAAFEIPQGRCRDFVLTDTNTPCMTNGSAFCGGLSGIQWEVRLYGEVIATPCSPHGWSVESDHGVYGGVNICAPSDALTARRYEVRFLEVVEGITNARSGYFSVIPAGMSDTAPVLQPMEISLPTCSGNTPVTVTVSLDAPAREQEAIVAISVTGIVNTNIPAFVRIPMGETSTSFTFRPALVTNDTPFELTASYNGVRNVSGTVIVEPGSIGFPVVSAISDARRMVVTWTPVAGALTYEVWRADDWDYIRLANGLTGTCFVDEAPSTNTWSGNCYNVVAVNSLTSESSFVECTFFTPAVLRPRITPHGGRFNDFVWVTISCETTNATIRYTTDGTIPSLANGTNYAGPFKLATNAQIIAKAFVGSNGSLDDRADFHIAEATPMACGVPVQTTITDTNQPSTFFGPGSYAARYRFEGLRGDAIVVTASSPSSAPFLALIDPNKQFVYRNGEPLTSIDGLRPAILSHTLRTNGTYVVEVIGGGEVTVKLDCFPGPELDVFHLGSELANESTLDFGITNNGINVTKTITLTNSGSDTLTFSSVSMTPPQLFFINPTNLTTLAPSNKVDVTITFNAASNGPWSGVLTLNNDDTFDDSPEGTEFDETFVVYLEAFANPPGVAPIVNITSPTTNAVVTMPPAVTISATTTTNGTDSITGVVFYAKQTVARTIIGSATSNSLNSWSISWSNAPAGVHQLTALAKDSAGRAAFSPAITVTNNLRPVAVNDRFTVYRDEGEGALSLLANDYDGDGAFVLTNIMTGATNGVAWVSNGVALYNPTGTGTRDYFTYQITDAHGATATAEVRLTTPPSQYFIDYFLTEAEITSPATSIETNVPVAITGIATSEYLHFWELSYRRRGNGAAGRWTQMSTAETNVNNGPLGTFDPTALPNGQYEIQLRVVDITGGQAEALTRIRVTQPTAKIGHFTLAFTDLQIPVSGLPITLTRSYDSRNTDSGDFGAGWNLDVSSVRLEKSGIMGEGWEAEIQGGLFGFLGYIFEPDPHLVTITFPDDTVYRFRPVLDLNSSGTPRTGSVGLDAAWASFTYAALPGTRGTLRELNPARQLDVNFTDVAHPVTFHDSNGTVSEAEEDADSGPIYDPKEFEFTTLDGRKFQFNSAGKVTKMIDRVGNSLTFGDDGILHSSGKSVKFLRDAAGRITEIYDPNGLDTNGQPAGPAALRYQYDNATGNLIHVHRLTTRSATDPKYLTTQFGYENAKYPHYITSITDPRGVRAIRNEFADDGKLKSMTDANGKTINYIHSVSNRTEIIVDRMGNTNRFVYDPKGNVTEAVNALGHTNRFTYDANNNQLTHTDPLGHTTTNVFDAFDNLVSVTLPHRPGENPAAFTTRFTHDDHGNQLTVTLPTGAVISNTVDGATGDLLAVRAGTNLITSFVYDTSGNVTAEGDRFGTNGFAYDVFGNATHMTNTLGQVIASGYDPNGNLTNLVDNGTASSFTYDAMNREAFSDYGNGITLSNGFDSHLDWTSVDAPTIGHLERRFDEQGKLAGWKTVNGATPGFAYNDNGQLEYETNALGQVTRHVHDAAGRQIAAQNLTTGATSGSGFDAANRRIAETNALGGFTLRGFNPDGSLAATTNAFLTNYWLHAYETGGGCCGGSGATTTTTDPLGREVMQVASPYGLPLQTIRRAGAGATGGNAATNSIVYLSGMVSSEQEAEDYPTAITDEGGRTRNLEYNPSGQLRRATDLSGSAWWTNWFNTTNGIVNRVDSPTREITRYFHDALENVSAIQFPDDNYLTNFYDAANRLNGVRLPSGTLLTNFFDTAGRQTNRQARVNGSVTENVGLSYNANDTVTIMTDNTGGTTNVLDATGQFIGLDYPTGASVRYGRDLLGQIIAVTNKASGGGTAYVTRYVRDLLGQVIEVIDPWNRTNRFEPDRVGRRAKRILANGVTSEWKYNWKDQVTNLTHKTSGGTVLASVAYERLPGGEPSKITREDGSYVLLAYDSALRLTNEVFHNSGGTPLSTNGYGYDLAGTRLRLNKGGTMLTNAVTAGYRVTQVKNGTTIVENYDHDLGGRVTNIVRDGITNRLGYNAADQLTAVTNGATWNTYTHDGSGRRTQATNSAGTVRRFLVAPTPDTDLESPHLVANAGGTLQQGYVFLGDEPLLRFDASGNPVYYLEDAMGSIVGLVSNGTSIATFSYDGFGNFRSVSGTTNAPTGTGGDFRFHGAWLETDTGLLHLRAREYDQRTGRFLSRDPDGGGIETPESLHPYNFADSNPHVFSDPTGEFTVVEISIGQALQFALNTMKNVAVNEVKAYATGKITDAFTQTLLRNITPFIKGFNFDKMEQYLSADPLGTGRQFDKAVRIALCKLFADEGYADQLHHNVQVVNSGSRLGDPVSAGRNCNTANPRVLGQRRGARYSVPDFIFGQVPLTKNGIQKTHLIAEVKSLASTMYGEYILPGRKKEQLNAILAYSKKHTDTHIAIFFIARNNMKQNFSDKARYYLMKRVIGVKALSQGVIPAVVAVL